MMKTLRRLIALPIALTSALALAACGAESSADTESWRDATSAEDGGGMDALIEAAQAEGAFNSMGLYEDWANYGGILAAFSEKYDIEINNDVSTGASQDLINAVKNRQGQDDSLDYLDTGMSFADSADNEGLLAQYEPEVAGEIPAEMKSENNTWYNHLGGNMAIGCDAAAIDNCPESFADLKNPEYAGKIALTGDPTSSESAFMAVYAAALANDGSLDDVQPGIDFFAELSEAGNLVAVTGNEGTMETGETPILINWDYLMAPMAENLSGAGVDLQIIAPEEGTVSSYYAASLNADAPHPATARLFMEFLMSDEGQNLLLEGYVRPVRLQEMVEAGTVNQEALDRLPESILQEAPQPDLEQRATQQAVVVEQWAEAVA
ncbi:extracellular solute-binding protein [Corynebacterium casei]|uniref:extracellular solute-binding protein n=2 Tax=Corynebacterium casei TaxID=160386 RepID=UPI003F91952B